MSLKQEESLFSGLRRQVEATRERHQEQMAGLEADRERLHAELAALKREAAQTRTANAAALEEHERTLAATVRLQSQLEALQVAYSGAVDDREHFQAGEAMAADEAAQLGPLRRALCFKDERIAELEERVRRAVEDAAHGIEVEQAVAAGLRERIGRLERRLRDTSRSGEERARSASAENEHELAVARAKLERAQCESQDAREALAKEVAASKRERRRAEAAEDALRDAREEATHYREAAGERDALRRRISVLEESLGADGDGGKSPRALRPLSPNTPKDASPTSPSRITRLQRELAHALSQHAALKAAHDELRDKHVRLSAKRDKERQHFKEFHAVYMARKEAKRKRRETSGASGASGGPARGPFETSGQVGPTPPGPSSHPSSALERSSPAINAIEGAVGDADDVERPAKRPRPSPPAAEKAPTPGLADVLSRSSSMPRRERSSVSPEPAPAPSRSALAPNPVSPPSVTDPTDPVPEPAPQGQLSTSAATVPSPAPKPRASTSAQASTPTISRTRQLGASTPAGRPGPSMSTPAITRTPTGLTRQASRVTPWLGGTRPASASTSSRKPVRRDSFGSDDEAPSPVPPRRPLVRDRTGTSTMLRKEALRRSTDSRGPVAVDSPLKPAADSSAVPTTPGPADTPRLDLEHLTPAERAAERKRLASLPFAERRRLYAAYKGNGRYVAPEDVRTTFADEFEIDPERNDGVPHQFDAVVRNRDARRRMHGGDCECCRDYYAAVGDLPRFHSAPAWRDEPEGDSAVDIEDHQNRVSRHREVWRRPPTPPDYWRIAFPTTQEVESVNRRADEMTAAREAEVRREAAHRDSKWRRRAE